MGIKAFRSYGDNSNNGYGQQNGQPKGRSSYTLPSKAHGGQYQGNYYSMNGSVSEDGSTDNYA